MGRVSGIRPPAHRGGAYARREVGMRNAENKKRRRAKGKGIGWKVEGGRLKAQGVCMRSNLNLFGFY